MLGQVECVDAKALRGHLHLPVTTEPLDGEKDLIPREFGTLTHHIIKPGARRAGDESLDPIICLTMNHHDRVSMHSVGQNTTGQLQLVYHLRTL